ncbi:transmembrane protein 174 [Peromyscus leucopus]|uniref:transmembrane protein 174 n=1 Tax=Peromyscus leucopus TaxID=10041 RepID=UPI0010A1322F|nr:transmembrane protein 174 [Peromyscus leucopus]
MEHSNNRPEDFPLNVFSVTPYTPSTADIQVSDDDKAGATLLFSGIFLGLVGITFTVMGWIKYQGVSHFEWTQLLGPILLSVGVTFILIAVCKFKMLSCQGCTEGEERGLDSDQTSGGQSFVFTGINQPITFHGATVVQYIPPPYGAQEPLGMNAAYLQPMMNPCGLGLVPSSGAVAATPSPPQYYTIYPQDNAAFVENEGYPPFVGVRNDRPSSDANQPEGMQMEEEDSVRFSPPPYEEIYTPSLARDCNVQGMGI